MASSLGYTIIASVIAFLVLGFLWTIFNTAIIGFADADVQVEGGDQADVNQAQSYTDSAWTIGVPLSTVIGLVFAVLLSSRPRG